MRIVTTPMCEEIVKLAGIDDYAINKFPTSDDGDLAILLSESKTDMDSIYLKLNTFNQIVESIEKVADRCGTECIIDFNECEMAGKYLNCTPENSTKVKVYSNFLKDIVEDMGFEISEEDYDYIVAPDYLIPKIEENQEVIIEIPSHGSVSPNPIKRACQRYAILEDFINK
ncbi:MAG: hypothetical protein Q4P18_01230 [Methanobrevibacter sp.]|uniref:hypothetical protein n=1 Tax=Methanobrevibacter sp. TaxID=66852 RepID=UPI0026DF9405|nr:hypothetical protein [Methanobrevibacter sp.]MDO5848137.1 hypothetical protein [Methanobrevibacter sp.]